MHDRPAEIFRSASLQESHQLFMELESANHSIASLHSKWYDEDCSVNSKLSAAYLNNRSLFTSFDISSGTLSLRSDRPVLVVSSTSWTDDEDFGLFYRACVNIQAKIERNVLVLITGKGPNRAAFEEQFLKDDFPKLSMVSVWLSAENYARLLGSADLGISMHFSSSGIDLPMKVVDMFGCCLPVCAKNFACISELVQHGQNGWLFDSQEDLEDQLLNVIQHFPQNLQLLQMRSQLQSFQNIRFQDEWKKQVSHLFIV